jgi:hypothetical protein
MIFSLYNTSVGGLKIGEDFFSETGIYSQAIAETQE